MTIIIVVVLLMASSSAVLGGELDYKAGEAVKEGEHHVGEGYIDPHHHHPHHHVGEGELYAPAPYHHGHHGAFYAGTLTLS